MMMWTSLVFVMRCRCWCIWIKTSYSSIALRFVSLAFVCALLNSRVNGASWDLSNLFDAHEKKYEELLEFHLLFFLHFQHVHSIRMLRLLWTKSRLFFLHWQRKKEEKIVKFFYRSNFSTMHCVFVHFVLLMTVSLWALFSCWVRIRSSPKAAVDF